jgi:uncharacterized protein (TIGR02246 family)
MIKLAKIALVMIACGLACVTLDASAAATSKHSKPSSNPGKTGKSSTPVLAERDDEVRDVLIGLATAIAANSSEDAAALFAEDANFIDQSGEEIRGRAALHSRFDQRAKAGSASSVGIHPQSIAFPAETVALVLGEVSRRQGQQDLPASRFSMVLIKKDGKWRIAELHETAIQAAQNENRLRELDWLIGQWSAERPDATAQLSFDWDAEKKFITSKVSLSRNGKNPQVDTQMIGWDPQHSNIVSWHFDGNGGFGSGIWTKQADDNKWTVNVTGVGADGSNSLASNVFSLKSPDEFTWQSIHRSLDGTAVPDTEPITVHRVKH